MKAISNQKVKADKTQNVTSLVVKKPAANVTKLSKVERPAPSSLPVKVQEQNKVVKPVVEHPPPQFAKKDPEEPVKEAPKAEVVKAVVAEMPKENPTPVPTVVANAVSPGTQNVHIEIMAGTQPITIDLVDGKQLATNAPIAIPVITQSSSPQPQAAVTIKSESSSKDQQKLDKMKEIQDSVKSLKKQMEEIEKKDREDDKNEQNKDDDDEAVLIKEHTINREQILKEIEAKENATHHVNATTNKTMNISAEPKKVEHKENSTKFDRFLKF